MTYQMQGDIDTTRLEQAIQVLFATIEPDFRNPADLTSISEGQILVAIGLIS